MSKTIYTNYRKICQEHNGYTDDQMKGMHVHHIDIDHTNNNPENLLLCTPKEHAEFHPHMKNWISKQHAAAVAGGKASSPHRIAYWERWRKDNIGYKDKWKINNYIKLGYNSNSSAKVVEMNSKSIECPHCGKSGNVGNMKRWHFDNCKIN